MDREDTELLLDAAQRWFKDHEPLATRIARLREGQHEGQEAWSQMAGMGWLALSLPEAAGGFDAGHAAVFELLRHAGRDARPEPLGLHLLLAPLRLALEDEGRRDVLGSALGEGRIRLAMADVALGENAVRADAQGHLHGRAGALLGAEYATHLLLPATDADGQLGLAEVALTAGGIHSQAARLVDGRTTWQIRFDGAPARWLSRGGDTASQAVDLAAASLVADSAGVLEAAFDLTLDYLKQRVQFGKPLSAQQAVQHKMAEVFCDLQQLMALSRRVAAEMDVAPRGPWPTLAAAKAYLGRRALRACGQLIQVSGGIAVTEEYKLTQFYRRLHVSATLFGTAEAQLARIDVRESLLAA